MVFFLFLFGLAAGSFLNVVVYRLNEGGNPLKGRSFCPGCKHQLTWADNLPLLSFVFLRAKCRYCHSPISWQYPLVEAATAILSVGIFYWSFLLEGNSFLLTVYYLLMGYGLVAIFASDWRWQTIPDEITYPMGILALGRALMASEWIFLGVALAAGAFLGSLHWLTRGKGMALGDVKLALVMGLFLGWPATAVALWLAFVSGALFGVILIALKKAKLGQKIAFGPFLVGGTLAALFWGEVLVNCFTKCLFLR